MAEPMYRQIAEDLQGRIESGELAPGEKLPSEMEFRERYNNASRNTIRDAIKRLTSQGLVETRPGPGHVRHHEDRPLRDRTIRRPGSAGRGRGRHVPRRGQQDRRIASHSDPRVEITGPRPRGRAAAPRPAEHAGRLQTSKALHRRPSMVPADVLLPHGLRHQGRHRVARGRGHRRRSRALHRQARSGSEQVGYRDWITARRPDVNEQTFFGLAHDATVFENFRTAFDQTGTPLRVTVTIFPPTAISSSLTSGTYQTPSTRPTEPTR